MTELARRQVVPMQTRVHQSSLDDAFVAMTDEQEQRMTTPAIGTTAARSAPHGARRRRAHAPGVRAAAGDRAATVRARAVGTVLGRRVPARAADRARHRDLIQSPSTASATSSSSSPTRRSLMVFTLTILALNALPPVLASYREKGYLRRLSTTPIGAWRLLAAEVVDQLRRQRVAVVADRGDRANRVRRAAARRARRVRAGDGARRRRDARARHADLGARAVRSGSRGWSARCCSSR